MNQQQIPLEKILQMYGKACLERDMAFERITGLEAEVELLNRMLKKTNTPPDDEKPEEKTPGPIKAVKN